MKKTMILSAIGLSLMPESLSAHNRNLNILNDINKIYQDIEIKRKKEGSKIIKGMLNEPVRSTSGGFMKIYIKA